MKNIDNIKFARQFAKQLRAAHRRVAAYRADAPPGFDPQAAATVLTGYGVEGTVISSTPSTYAPLKPDQFMGRLRIATFSKLWATEAAGTNIGLTVIPKGARVISGMVQVSSTTGSATIAIGVAGYDGSGFIDSANSVSDNTGFFLAAQTITTTAQVPLAATIAINSLYETSKQLWLTATTAAAAMAGQTMTGWIVYVLD